MTPGVAVLLVWVGATMQLALMLYPWTDVRRSTLVGLGVMVLLVCAVGLAIGSTKHKPEDFAAMALLACGLFAGMLTWRYPELLLPRIRDTTIVLWTPVFVYALALVRSAHVGLFGLMASIAVAVIAILAWIRTLIPPIKLALYCWYLLMIVLVAGLQFSTGEMHDILELRTQHLDAARVLIDGMGMTYLGIYGWYLYQVLPIPGRGESFDSRMKDWHRQTEIMEGHFSDERLSRPHILVVVLGVGVLLALNLMFEAVPPWTMINLVLVGASAWSAVIGSRQGAGQPRTEEPAEAPKEPGGVDAPVVHGKRGRHRQKLERRPPDPR
jgi:hypothetical protein